MADATVPPLPPFAVPPQKRGRERRDSIVSAAYELIDEHGPHSDVVSARKIAERAGTSVGTLYHYFADVDEITAAVAQRYMLEMIEATDSAALRPCPETWVDLLSRTQLAFVRYFRSRPGLRQLWFATDTTQRVAEIHRHYRGQLAERLQHEMHLLTGTRLDLVVHSVHVALSGTLYQMAFEAAPTGDPRILAELQLVGHGYFERHLARPEPDIHPQP